MNRACSVPADANRVRIDLPVHHRRDTLLTEAEQRPADFATRLTALFALLYRYLDKDHLSVALPHLTPEGDAANAVVQVSLEGAQSISSLQDRIEAAMRIGPVANERTTVPSAAQMLQHVQCCPTPLNEETVTTGRFDLCLAFDPDFPRHAEFIYQPPWDLPQVRRFAEAYSRVLAQAITDPSKRLDDLTVLSRQEIAQQAPMVSGPRRGAQDKRTVHECFEHQTARTPENIAATDPSACLTYAQLNAAADQIAHALVEIGLGPGQVVAVHIPRGVSLLICVLGVMKAGGVFFLINPDDPEARNAALIGLANSAIGLCETPPTADGLRKACSWIRLEDTRHFASKAALPKVASNDLAYVISTSGTTGTPKLVTVSHASLVNRFTWLQQVYDLGAADVSLHRSAYSFDPSICEMLRLLPVGGQVCFMPHGKEADFHAVINAIHAHSVSIVDLVPSPLTALLDVAEAFGAVEKLQSLRWILGGAEVLPEDLADRFNRILFAPYGTHLINTWGATETTVDATWFDCSTQAVDGPIPIGNPIANCRAYVLSRAGNPMPYGWPGELCIAGACLAEGYLGAPEETARRFVAAPALGEARLYRSGDLAMFRLDGLLQFLGRCDRQLNIRGVRIDPFEVAVLLNRQSGITDAVVAADTAVGGAADRLLAWVVPSKAGAALSQETMIQSLAEHLPPSMIPDRIFLVAAFPRTAHDKVDLAALRKQSLKVGEVHPNDRTDDALDRRLIELAEELLEREGLSIHDDFFDIGGQSLAVIRLAARIKKHLGAELTVSEIFGARTLRGIADCIRQSSTCADSLEIPRIDAQPVCESGHAQRRIWAMSTSEAGSIAYNVPFVLRVSTRFDRARLQQAMDQLVARHEILRTHFELNGTELLQVVQPAQANFVPLADHDLTDHGKDAQTAFLNGERLRPFDLNAGPLLRCGILRTDHGHDIFYLTIHHIVVDAWSLSLLLGELFETFGRPGHENAATAGPPALQYKDYTAWHNSRVREQGRSGSTRFWQHYLADAPMLSLLAGPDRTKPNRGVTRRRKFHLRADQQETLLSQARAQDATLFMALLTAFSSALAQHFQQPDFVIGTPVSGRTNVALEEMLGCFVNPLPIRIDASPQSRFADQLKKTRERCLAAFDYQDYPFDLIVRDSGLRRHGNTAAIFNTMLVLQDAPDFDLEHALPGLSPEVLELEDSPAKLELILTFEEAQDGLRGYFDYDTSKLSKAAIEKILSTFLNEIEKAASKSATQSSLPPSKPSAPRTAGEPSSQQCSTLSALFERQAARTPHCIATVYNDTYRSYDALNASANRLANCLRDRFDIGSHKIVAILMDRTDQTVMIELAVLKTGAAFLPLDGTYPIERIQAILSDADPSLVLIETEAMRARFAGLECLSLCLTELNPTLYSSANPGTPIAPDDPAYVIFTSGSTGQPKGVVVSHRNICSILCHEDWLFDFLADDVWTAFHSVSFDFSIWEMFLPLTRGARVVFVPKAIAKDPARFAELIEIQNVTVLCQVPSAFYGVSDALVQMTADKALALRWVIFGGEPINLKPIEALQTRWPHIRFVNGYGISETTILSTFKEIYTDAECALANIGTEIGNQNIHLLDSTLTPVASGAQGEICIEGAAVALGYLNRPDLTRESFVTLPDGRRVYRSGDLASRAENGDLIFAGRRDSQVKIRGHRVELEEVRACFLQCEAVLDAAIVTRDTPAGLLQMEAAVRPANAPNTVTAQSVRDQIAEVLPGYMVPTKLIVVDSIPLDPNGKADKAKLREMLDVLPHEAGAPTSRHPSDFLRLVEEVLGVKGVRASDDFFDIGGHSLSAVQLVSRVAEVFGTEISIEDVFETPLIEALAKKVRPKAGAVDDVGLVAASPAASYPLSPTQNAFWLLEHFRTPGLVVETPSVQRLNGPIDPTAAEDALRDLFAAYEILRTTFSLIDTKPRQIVRDQGAAREAFCWHDLSAASAPTAAVQDIFDREVYRPFDLENAPLFRLTLVRLSDEAHLAICTISHIIADGSTLDLLMDQWRAAHDRHLNGCATALRAPKIQFRDFVDWQSRYLAGPDGQADLKWWRDGLSDRPQRDLFAHWPEVTSEEAQSQSFYAPSFDVVLDEAATKALTTLCKRVSATPFMGLHALVSAFLYANTGQTDLCISSPFEHRFKQAIKDQPGPYVNLLLLRTQVRPTGSFDDLLRSTRDRAVAAFQRCMVPPAEIARGLNVPRPDMLSDIGLTLQSQHREQAACDEPPDLVLPPESFGLGQPLWLDARVLQSALNITVTYDAGRFDVAALQGAFQGFVDLSSTLLAQPSLSIDSIIDQSTPPAPTRGPNITLDI